MRSSHKCELDSVSVSLGDRVVRRRIIGKNKRILGTVRVDSTTESNYRRRTGACFSLGTPEITNFMCKFASKKNSILLDNKKRVRVFFRKPRYTHYCSVWYIIESAAAAAEEEAANGADRRTRIN